MYRILIVLISILSVYTQNSKLKVFLDCRGGCNRTFIKDEINFVDFVRNIEQADISIFITNIRTASGGRDYSIEFKGFNMFEGVAHNISFISKSTDTDRTRQDGLTKTIKSGLIPYLMRTDQLSTLNIDISAQEEHEASTGEKIDPWDSWVFEIGVNGNADYEELNRSYEYGMDFEIQRVTEESKFELELEGQVDVSEYDFFEDDTINGGERKITSTYDRNNYQIDGLYVHSVSEHFSIGGRSEFQSSSFSNLKKQFSIEPGVEYNFLPYSEATKRQVRVNLFYGYEYNIYDETTIFNKDEEGLSFMRFNISTRFKQEWGDVNFSVWWKNFLDDTSKRRINIHLNGFIRIWEGLRLRGSTGYSKISDQIYLPKEDLTKEERLLQIRQQRTDYSYYFWVGISYSFGSIYSDVVNPRFGF